MKHEMAMNSFRSMFFKKREKKEIKKWEWILIFGIVAVSLLGKVYYRYHWPKALARIGGRDVAVLVADTQEHRSRGWGGRGDMGRWGGMLFAYGSADGQHAMVMRDMKFPVDIVWIRDNKIVDIAPNVQPEPGKNENQLTPYFARLPSNMVLELPAGFTIENKVKIGDMVEIVGNKNKD